MKKLLALLLALTMVFAVTACGNSSDNNGNGGNGSGNITGGTENLTENDIAGDWEMIVEASDILEMMSENADAFENNEALSMFNDMGNFNTDAKTIIDISFEEDGEAIIVMDVNNMMDFYSELLEDYLTYLEDGGLEEMLKAAGQDMDALLDQLEEQGMSIDDYLEYMRQMMELSMDSIKETIEDNLKDVVGEWEFDGNTIKFIGEESKDNTDIKVLGYNGNKMSCAISGKGGDVEIEIDVTLKRK